MRRIKGYRAFFKRYGVLRGLILLSLVPVILAVLAGIETISDTEVT